MNILTNNNENIRAKNSVQSIIGFFVLLSPLILVTLTFCFYFVFGRLTSVHMTSIISNVLTYWIILAPILSFVVSKNDLKKEKRSKKLSKITIVLCKIVFAVMILIFFVSLFKDIKAILQ